MAWTIKYTASAAKDIKKLDPQVQRKIRVFLEDDLATMENPRSKGKGLTANHAGLWRYRIGDFRIICNIEDHQLIVLVLAAGHRKNIYGRY